MLHYIFTPSLFSLNWQLHYVASSINTTINRNSVYILWDAEPKTRDNPMVYNLYRSVVNSIQYFTIHVYDFSNTVTTVICLILKEILSLFLCIN